MTATNEPTPALADHDAELLAEVERVIARAWVRPETLTRMRLTSTHRRLTPLPPCTPR